MLAIRNKKILILVILVILVLLFGVAYSLLSRQTSISTSKNVNKKDLNLSGNSGGGGRPLTADDINKITESLAPSPNSTATPVSPITPKEMDKIIQSLTPSVSTISPILPKEASKNTKKSLTDKEKIDQSLAPANTRGSSISPKQMESILDSLTPKPQ